MFECMGYVADAVVFAEETMSYSLCSLQQITSVKKCPSQSSLLYLVLSHVLMKKNLLSETIIRPDLLLTIVISIIIAVIVIINSQHF